MFFTMPPLKTVSSPPSPKARSIPVVPEWIVVLSTSNPLSTWGANVAVASGSTSTCPPFSRIRVAVPPEETNIRPPGLTVTGRLESISP